MTSRFALAAVAALSVVTVSACSTSVGGTAVEAPATAPPSVTVAGAGNGTPIRWVNVDAEAPQLPRDTEGLQYGTDAKPGVGFGYRNAEKKSRVCTLGPAVRERGGSSRTGFLTAGHCSSGKPATPAYLSTTANSRGPQALMGNVEAAQDDHATNDAAVIWAPVAPDAGRIAGKWPVAGIMAKTDVPSLVKPGDPVCVDGARSGVVCSDLISADGGVIRTKAVTQGNDSGSAVFVVAPGGSAIVIGIHSGVEGSAGVATYVSPILDRLNADVVLGA